MLFFIFFRAFIIFTNSLFRFSQFLTKFPFYFQKLLLNNSSALIIILSCFVFHGGCLSDSQFRTLRKRKLLDSSLKPLIWLKFYNLLFTKFCDKQCEVHCEECSLMCHGGLGTLGCSKFEFEQALPVPACQIRTQSTGLPDTWYSTSP